MPNYNIAIQAKHLNKTYNKKKIKPVNNAMISKFLLKIILFIFFVSKINARGNTTKKPRDVRAKLNVNGPICSIPIA